MQHLNRLGWDDLESPQRADLIAFYQTAEHERAEWAKAGIPRMA